MSYEGNGLNVRSIYKDMTFEEIRATRQRRVLPFVVALKNVTYDFNKSSAIRNANNFLAQAVALIGNKKWDRRGAVGTHHYVDIEHYDSMTALVASYANWPIVGFENTGGAESLTDFKWPHRCIMLFGEENKGLEGWDLSWCDYVVEIPTLGTVRSLNVATASGIAMYDYVRYNGTSNLGR